MSTKNEAENNIQTTTPEKVKKPKSKSTIWLVRTALMLAIVVVAQIIGKLIPAGAVILGPMSLSQLITGSLVNMVLIVTVATLGMVSGVTVGILSALLATLLGIGPIFPIITPAIAIGNAVLVLVVNFFFYLASKNKQKLLLNIVGIVVAAGAKCAFLWITVPQLLKLVPEIKEKQQAMLTIMFSYPQAVTAVVGGIIALMIIPILKKVIKKA